MNTSDKQITALDLPPADPLEDEENEAATARLRKGESVSRPVGSAAFLVALEARTRREYGDTCFNFTLFWPLWPSACGRAFQAEGCGPSAWPPDRGKRSTRAAVRCPRPPGAPRAVRRRAACREGRRRVGRARQI